MAQEYIWQYTTKMYFGDDFQIICLDSLPFLGTYLINFQCIIGTGIANVRLLCDLVSL